MTSIPPICPHGFQLNPPPTHLSALAQGAVSGVLGSRLGLASELGSSRLLLHFCKTNPVTRMALTPGALYYWSSCPGLLFYINKQMSKN
uniref:Uncharacterized protein n=1 Tax=Macaca fascicularis TaxID=9541 RepID=Q2PG41_MACFA|nr:hypothetical protein [Macaca fascicularis]